MTPSIEPIKLTVGFDCGTSTGKGLATWQSDEYPYDQMERHYLIPSAMQSLSQDVYEQPFEFGMGRPSAESCMLSYLDPETNEQAFWQMGLGAVEPGRINAKERKFKTCLAKVLSFLGYLARGEIKTTAPIHLTLGLLLPLDEFGDRHVFVNLLKSAVSSFEHDGVTVDNIKLTGINIKPEGYGIYKAGGYGSAAVINWGHSDLTMLIFVKGLLSMEHSKTYPLAGMYGFMWRLDFPITYEVRGAQIISAAGTKMDENILKELTQTKGVMEMAQLKKAIAETRSRFWEVSLNKFSLMELAGLNAILIGGGTSSYFESELNEFYKPFGRTDWGKPTTKEFSKRFGVKTKTNPSTPSLFKDVYGYFRTLPGVEQYEAKTVEVVA